MSVTHLKQLREALTRRRWQITERLRGEDNVEGAATWQIQRDGVGPILLLDFAGLGDMGQDIDVDQSYAVDVRGHERHGLYFRHVNRSRGLWNAELTAFVRSLDSIIDADSSVGQKDGE